MPAPVSFEKIPFDYTSQHLYEMQDISIYSDMDTCNGIWQHDFVPSWHGIIVPSAYALNHHTLISCKSIGSCLLVAYDIAFFGFGW